MFNRITPPFSKIEYNTLFTDKKNEELYKIINSRANNHETAKMELVLRAMNGDNSLKDEALNICNKILNDTPTHNFFNLAYGMLGHEAERTTFLLTACHSTQPCGELVSAQAAYQLARYYYFKNEYLLSQIWFTNSIIKGYEKSEIDFVTRGSAYVVRDNIDMELFFYNIDQPSSKKDSFIDKYILKPDYICSKMILKAMLIIIKLSQKKLSLLDRTHFSGPNVVIDINGVKHPSWIPLHLAIPLHMVNQTKYIENALSNPDTALFYQAKNILSNCPTLFITFINECFKHDAIKKDVYDNIFTFVKENISEQYKHLLNDVETSQSIQSTHYFSLFTNQPSVIQNNLYLTTESSDSGSLDASMQSTDLLSTNLMPVYLPTKRN